MRNILVVTCHSDPHSFTRALAAAYVEGAAAAGAHVEQIELHDLRFDPVLRRPRPGEEPQPLEPDLLRARAAIVQADHVAWLFPTWWSSTPALLKGFIDRAFLPGFAYAYQEGKVLPVRLLRGRSARIVTTMDSPGFWYALVYRRALHRAFGTATLTFSGFAPVAATTFSSLHTSTDKQRARALEKVRADGGRDARAKPKSVPAEAPRAADAARSAG